MSEFNLSVFIQDDNWVKLEHVKEFIKRLKEGIKEETNQLWCLELINKLAGEDLK